MRAAPDGAGSVGQPDEDEPGVRDSADALIGNGEQRGYEQPGEQRRHRLADRFPSCADFAIGSILRR